MTVASTCSVFKMQNLLRLSQLQGNQEHMTAFSKQPELPLQNERGSDQHLTVGGRGGGVWVVTPALYLVSKTNFRNKFRGSSSTFFCKRLDAVQGKARRLTRCLLLSISGLGRNTAWQQQLQHLLFGSVFHCTSSWTVIYVSGKRWEVDIVLMQ